jgi:hypothetical protein
MPEVTSHYQNNNRETISAAAAWKSFSIEAGGLKLAMEKSRIAK